MIGLIPIVLIIYYFIFTICLAGPVLPEDFYSIRSLGCWKDDISAVAMPSIEKQHQELLEGKNTPRENPLEKCKVAALTLGNSCTSLC